MLAIVIASTLIVLFLMTGSVVLPIKAVLMNALNLSAVFGILVLIFQDGRLAGPALLPEPGRARATQPILLFAIAFGLATDYGVFLLSRIKEAHDGGCPDTEAVAIGLERTGRIVTAAALLFAVAIGAFATSEIMFIKELGVGTALAVLIDASIIRALLVPSLMAAARQVELVGAGAAAAPARADRAERGRGPAPHPGARPGPDVAQAATRIPGTSAPRSSGCRSSDRRASSSSTTSPPSAAAHRSRTASRSPAAARRRPRRPRSARPRARLNDREQRNDVNGDVPPTAAAFYAPMISLRSSGS